MTTATVNGHEFQFIEPRVSQPAPARDLEPYFSAPLAEPTKAHQRTLTEQVRSTTDLPPLITRATESNGTPTAPTDGTSFFGPHGQVNDTRFPLETQRQISPARTTRSTLFNNDKNIQIKADEKVGKFASWFNGESEPIKVGILPSPTKEKQDPLDTMISSSDIRPINILHRSSTAQTTSETASKPATASRFSFITSKIPSMAKNAPQRVEINDEIIDMNINTALFPSGTPDPFSPAAFKNLQQQAEGLLLRLQTAYKERTILFLDMTAEKETLAEETQGAETKARHLKTQLDDLSAKLAEQDEAMMNLVDDLAQEKLARREEEEARKRSVRLVEHNMPPRTKHRRDSVTNTLSDSGFESEDESSAESIFSRRNGAHSPTMSMSSVSTNNSPVTSHTPNVQTPTSMPQTAPRRRPMSHSVKGIVGSSQANVAEDCVQQTCANCNRPPVAGNSVDTLEEENERLKRRLFELEGALDGCLDIVSRFT